ncbi:MAG TPA: hypothetical protein VJP85_08125 [Candidatus Baltobacteraceae bacterium]|nr:hypothetical protein [Candidatus Baltobacteraceae bacterium]
MAIVLLAYEILGFAAVHSLLADFHAFWCAGSALAHGADPYRAAALSACERAPAPWGLYSAPTGVVVPAPLPPYALAAFAPLAYLPYSLAACLWFAAIAGALCACVVLLARVLRIGALPAAWMLLLPATVLWLPFGEATPFALLGALLAAYAAQRERWSLCALGLALLAVEPHLALGAWACVALFAARARAPLAIAGAALLGIALAAGPGLFIEYLRAVLPLHALAEVPRPAQYSATWLLDALGVSPGSALQAGAATYAASLIASVIVAVRLQRRWNDRCALVFTPLAAAVIGGTFVHASQIALALPFAAALATREGGRTAALAAAACGVLAVPWLQGDPQQTIVLAGIGVCAAVVFLLAKNAAPALRVLTASAVLAAVLVMAHRSAAPLGREPRTFPVAASPGELASASWGRYIWREQSSVTFADWLGKAPSWLALLVLAGLAAGAASNKEPVIALRVHEAPASP